MKTQKKTKTKKNKVVGIIIDVVLALAIIFAAFVTYSAYSAKQQNNVPGIFGLHMTRVLSDSMYPFFEEGDMVFTVDVKDITTLEKGDVISFWAIINGERSINTHRIVDIKSDADGSTVFVTQGDNNPVSDSQQVSAKELVGVYKFHADGLGDVFEYMQSPTGFLIVIVVPVGIFFIWQLVQFFIALFAYQGEKTRRAFAAQNGIVIADDEEDGEKPEKGEPAPAEEEPKPSEEGEKKE